MNRAVEYLRSLGRFPIVLKKSIPGYVVGRVSAAVWRECIDLVLQGVISVDDLDRAVSLGPAIGWAAAGPHSPTISRPGRAGSAVSRSTCSRASRAGGSSSPLGAARSRAAAGVDTVN